MVCEAQQQSTSGDDQHACHGADRVWEGWEPGAVAPPTSSKTRSSSVKAITAASSNGLLSSKLVEAPKFLNT